MSTEDAALTGIAVTAELKKKCAFSSWYEAFKGHTPRAEVIRPLPEEFVSYVDQRGIRLAREEGSKYFYGQELEPTTDGEYSDWEGGDSASERSFVPLDPVADFPEVHARVKQAIARFGAVAPKLNRSAPKDAMWRLRNYSMKCNEANDVYLLLNGSSHVACDVSDTLLDWLASTEDEPVMELVLREWLDVNPALEFRVFVRGGEVLGACQRDLNYYDYLKPLEEKLRTAIEDFVHDVMLQRLPDDTFVADVYIPRPFTKVWLIDVNPFARETDPLLFSWNELCTLKPNAEGQPELRLVAENYIGRFAENNIGRFAAKEHSEHQVPLDVVEAGLNPQSMQKLVETWRDLLKIQEEE
ncbi:ADR082Cp [Eremothecium gossypii ATCC 10895]|uniref:Cell division cycle protein 123 n=1 Tax=Eremothecium gossypii (strain ATCC 10895 / CBS 109.51 / FGSC 9923 / NRRL Y-1056) TaxID=284811 RepID=CD123_EREGS|nr:ADR082Cp [Eremothecium gossypii ATCC 10895]Q75A37.1 RecName: Full=Cell division cycle protein 123 [Eremothecium gossypii ATCC 10895]AAS52002.1 ADR082Cp [Eremothecium gossypii ATCC 10895]